MQNISDVVGELSRATEESHSLPDRIDLLQQCTSNLAKHAISWAQSACRAKGDSIYLADELLTGPAVVLRQLQLTKATLHDVISVGRPRLPGRLKESLTGRFDIPVVPAKGLYDALLFQGISASVRFAAGTESSAIHGDKLASLTAHQTRGIVAVLGAGNVSSIPVTDSLSKIFFDRKRVILKMNPVNEYLAQAFQDILAPLVDANLLRIVTGGADIGHELIHHPEVDSVHITGSDASHDRIVWGVTAEERARRKADNNPVLTKSISSELGNVTPWIIVPGEYRERELDAQAEHIASSITNNASFNCIATKLVITCRGWPQRDAFIAAIQKHLKATPLRPSYYPGAADRYQQFSTTDTQLDENGCLPWLFLPDQKYDERPDLFEQESFTCICAETALDAPSPVEFLQSAVSLANEKVTGTLCATITVTGDFEREHAKTLDTCIDELRYGTVCINQWSGLAYALITVPWGACPGSKLDNVESGIGSVHNTYLLDGFQKSVLRGPLINFPKPVWFAGNRKSVTVAKHLLNLYAKPALIRLPKLLLAALRG